MALEEMMAELLVDQVEDQENRVRVMLKQLVVLLYKAYLMVNLVIQLKKHLLLEVIHIILLEEKEALLKDLMMVVALQIFQLMKQQKM